METITEKQQIQQDIDWVEATIYRLTKTRDYRDIKHSLHILDKRKKSLLEKLQQVVELD